MSQAFVGLQYNKVEITSSNGRRVDLSSSITFMDYYEDLLSPCVTATMQIAANYSIFNLLPIRGGEKVTINASTKSGDFVFEGDYSLYVYKVSNLISEETSETFTLHLCSREALTNETSRVEKKYPKSPISEHVTSILKDVLITNKYKSENIEKTANSYSFIGTTKKPFHILTWLCPKGIPSTNGGSSGTSSGGGKEIGSGGSGIKKSQSKGVAGYLFYENRDGFNFRSIDTLVSKTKTQISSTEKEGIATYTLTGAIEGGSVDNDFKVLRYSFEKNIDLMRSLRLGMYSNFTYFYNLFKDEYTKIDYSIKNELKSKLGTNVPIPEDFANKPSRVLFKISDNGTLDPKNSNDDSGRDDADMAKSFARYNLLFTQSLNIIIPCNINLKVGSIIKLEFPTIDPSKQTTVEVDKEMSGLYLIREVCHHLEYGQMVSSVKLIRDSYGIVSV